MHCNGNFNETQHKIHKKAKRRFYLVNTLQFSEWKRKHTVNEYHFLMYIDL